MIFIWGWLASAAELLGLWMIGGKKKFGFLVSVIGNLIWIAVALLGLPATGLLLVVIPAMFINVRNFIRWEKQEKKTVEENCITCKHRLSYVYQKTIRCDIWTDKGEDGAIGELRQYNMRSTKIPYKIRCQHYERSI